MFENTPPSPKPGSSPQFKRSHTSSNSFGSSYDSAKPSDEPRHSPSHNIVRHSRSQSAKPRWLSHVKDWLSVNEPSAQAMKEQKTSTAKRHGVDLKDPDAAAKLHIPLGTVPQGATTSTTGPDPEKALRRMVKERQLRESLTCPSQETPSLSSRDSFGSPSISDKRINPWD